MSRKTRRHHSPQDKVRILRLHLLEGKAISEVCDSEGIHPTQFYQWQRIFFENGASAFERRVSSNSTNPDGPRLTALENKLRSKDEVIAEIMEDLVRLKKSHGAS
jgi:transposase-like protein